MRPREWRALQARRKARAAAAASTRSVLSRQQRQRAGVDELGLATDEAALV